MSYQVHNFQTGEVIEAAPVNEMDAQIQLNETKINQIVQLPTVTDSDDGKILMVVSGHWSAAQINNASGNSF